MDSKIEKGDTWGREETGHGSASRQRGGVLLSNPAPLWGGQVTLGDLDGCSQLPPWRTQSSGLWT